MPIYKNAFVPPPPRVFERDIHLSTAPEDYDLNFCLTTQPIGILKGADHEVEIEPLVPSMHAEAIYEVLSKTPGHFDFMPCTPWTSLQACLEWMENGRSDPASLYCVIRDLKRGGREIAGLMNYIRASDENLMSELGWIFIFPAFQRSHVTTHAASLMLDHAFRLPADGGWGLRRMQWMANDLNKPSVNAALRLGFVLESPISIRADRSLAAGQAGSYMGRAGDPLGLVGRQVGRSTSLLSITAEEWENGTAEHVRSLVTRYKAAAGK